MSLSGIPVRLPPWTDPEDKQGIELRQNHVMEPSIHTLGVLCDACDPWKLKEGFEVFRHRRAGMDEVYATAGLKGLRGRKPQ